MLCCVCSVLGHLAPVRPCAHSCVVLCVRCPEPLGSCSPVSPLGALSCVRGAPGQLAIVHRCDRSACCVVCAVSWPTWLLLTAVPALPVVLRVPFPLPLGSCSPPCSLVALCRVRGVLGYLAPVHWCARSVRCVECSLSWATWLLCTGVLPRCFVLCVRCPGPLSFSSAVRTFGVLCCVCGVLGLLAPVQRCARSVRCVACAVPWAIGLPFTGVLTRRVVSRVCCPGPLASCSPVRTLDVLCCVCGVPGPLGSCSPPCSLTVLCCVCVVLDHLAPVHQCARLVCCAVCAVSWAIGSSSPACTLRVLCCVCSVLGHLPPVHRCARSVWCAVCCLREVLGHLAPVHRCVRWVCCVACAGHRCGARTRPSGQPLFVAGRGCVPSRRAHVQSDGGCFIAGRGCAPTGRSHVHPDGSCSVAGRGWVRCRVRTRSSRGRKLGIFGSSGCLF